MLLALLSFIDEVQTQTSQDPDANVRRAAECLRRIPGLIEGKTPEDIVTDNAHWVVFQENRGRIGFPRTIIRFHKGVREGTFPNFDTSRVVSCISGLQRMPPSQ